MKIQGIAVFVCVIIITSLVCAPRTMANDVMDDRPGSLDSRCFEIKDRHTQLTREEVSWISLGYWSGYPRKPIVDITAGDCHYFVMTSSMAEAAALHNDLVQNAHLIDLLKKESCSDERGIIECPAELTTIQHELRRDR